MMVLRPLRPISRFRIFIILLSLSLISSCKGKGGEYPVGFPDECVAAYDSWRDMLDAMENSERLQHFQSSIESGREMRKKSLLGHHNPVAKKPSKEKIVESCNMMSVAMKAQIEKAERADTMSYEEFKQSYGHAKKDDLKKIFNRDD